MLIVKQEWSELTRIIKLANVINVVHLKTHTEFNLSNKPDLLCKIDTEDFYEHIEHRTHWYIHQSTKANIQRYYIRTIWEKGKGHKHLHREVLGLGEFTKDSVADHRISTETLDNRRSNLKETDHIGNSRNRYDRKEKDYIDPYRGCAICPTNKGHYQALLKSVYIASKNSISELHVAIDIKLEQLKQQGEI